MSLPAVSVRRPVTVLVCTLTVVVFGTLSAERLSVDLLPDLSYPTLTIQTEYPDAAPVSVEQFVTRPVEESVGVIPGVREMRSTSRAGLSEVVLEFGWDENMDIAALDVREKLGLVELPREAEVSRVLRFDPSLDPVMRLALSGDRPLDELRQVAERFAKPRLEAVKGIAAAKVRGGLDPEIQVEADEDRLAALGLTLSDLATALQVENVNRPGGVIKDWGSVFLVRTLNEFEDLNQLRRTVVRESADGRVRVEDVARVWRGHRDRDEITRADGVEVVELALHREGSANTVTVAAAARDEVARLNEEMGDGLALRVLSDQSRYISDAVSQVWSAAILGGILAILVLYFFLRDPVSTAIVAVNIPVSVLAAFLPMERAGVNINIMSLGGLALGVGMLVDSSIVVLEAIDRKRREGMPRRKAAVDGAGEGAGAVTASTLTTVAVFFPIVFVQGIAGQLFFDLAVTVCVSLFASLLVSLTLTPSLAAFDPSAGRTEPTLSGVRFGPFVLTPVFSSRTRLARGVDALLIPLRLVLLAAAAVIAVSWKGLTTAFDVITRPAAWTFSRLERAYPKIIGAALRHRAAVVGIAFVAFVGAIAAIPLLGTELVPDLRQGEFAFRLRLPEGTPLEATASVVERIETPLASEDRFTRIFSVVGSLPSAASGRQTLGENLAQIDFVLAEGASAAEEERAISRVRRVLDLFPDVEAELVHPSVLTVKPPVAVQVFSDDLEVLPAAAVRIARILGAIPGVKDVASTIEPGSPEIRVEVDRERAGALGVQPEDLSRSLRRQIRGEIVGQFREAEERLDIRLRAGERSRDRASEVEDLRVRLPGGSTVPISAVARVITDRGPAAIHRAGGARVAEVTGKADATNLGRVLAEVREALPSANLPVGVEAELSGQDREMRVSLRSLWLALALALFLVYVVMAVQFESLLHPLVILLSVPLGVTGAVLALGLTGSPVGVLSLIGLVMLIGIVVNNAIVLVDTVNRRFPVSPSLEAAIARAGEERLRPIVMTTATTVLGLFPMAVGLGAGDELRRPMAITVIGGLVLATVLTLVVIPCLYHVAARVFPGRSASLAAETAAAGAGGSQ